MYLLMTSGQTFWFSNKKSDGRHLYQIWDIHTRLRNVESELIIQAAIKLVGSRTENLMTAFIAYGTYQMQNYDQPKRKRQQQNR